MSIKSFASRSTQALFEGRRVARFANIETVATRKLQLLDSAASLEALRVPPSNRLETLKGDRRSQHSMRINDQFRLCFVWRAGDAYEVEIVDYH